MRVTRGTMKKSEFVEDSKSGPLYAVVEDNGKLLSTYALESEAQGELGELEAQRREENRKTQRAQLAQEEAEAKKRREQGIVEPEMTFNAEAQKLRERIDFLAAIARASAKDRISVKVFDETGKPVTVTERVGNEDLIFSALLNQKLNTTNGREGATT